MATLTADSRQLFSLTDTITGNITEVDFERVRLMTEKRDLWKLIHKSTLYPGRCAYLSRDKFTINSVNSKGKSAVRHIMVLQEVGTLNFPLEHVINCVMDIDQVHIFYPYTRKGESGWKHLDFRPARESHGVLASSICRWRFRMPFPLSGREVVMSRALRFVDGDRKKYIEVRKSCEHPDAPDTGSYTRAHMFSGLVLEQIDSRTTRYSITTAIDLRGWVSFAVIESMHRENFEKMHACLLQAITSRQAKKSGRPRNDDRIFEAMHKI